MSVLAVTTQANADGSFLCRWKWKENPTSRPHVGSICVTVDEMHKDERTALAEVQALYYLLETRAVHGANRLGTGIRVILSCSSIRKALLKGALKVSGEGKTSSDALAVAAGYLATKYFEASYEVQKWKDEDALSVEAEVKTHVGRRFSRVLVPSSVLNGEVQITRHAMHRWVGRISEQLDRYSENDLSKVPDSRWTKAWRWFVNVLSHKDTRRASLLPDVARKMERSYGAGCEYLHFSDTSTILVLAKRSEIYELVTVLRTNPHKALLQEERVMAGQQIRIPR